MPNRWVIGGALTIVAIMLAACVVAVLKIDLTPEKQPGKKPVRRQNLAEGIRISQHGIYGVDLVSIGKAHMRKLRKGPFTIGAINELVLEDVALALPEALWKDDLKAEGRDENSTAQPSASGHQPDRSPKAMLGRLGIDAGSLKMGGKMPRFSALAIKSLKVSRIDGANVVPWFSASGGKAERGGLKLYSGWSVSGGVTNYWKEALLVTEPKLMIVPMP